MHNVLDACISITRGLGLEFSGFFGPREMSRKMAEYRDISHNSRQNTSSLSKALRSFFSIFVNVFATVAKNLTTKRPKETGKFEKEKEKIVESGVIIICIYVS